MSRLIRCNRCEHILDIEDEKSNEQFGMGWAELLDANNNATESEKPIHLCPDCVRAFGVFMENNQGEN